MQWINTIKVNIGKFLLHRQLKTNTGISHITTIERAKHIAILYDATFIEQEQPIHRYISELKNAGKKVYTIGFVDMDKLPGNKKFSLQSDFCWHEKMNAFSLPHKPAFETFINTEFDLLLNFYTKPILPLLALSAFSKSKFKAGPLFEDGLNYFDAMIQTENSQSLQHLINDIHFYLNVIK
jgi:hypothetical protein